jgi:hypothetical protein
MNEEETHERRNARNKEISAATRQNRYKAFEKLFMKRG